MGIWIIPLWLIHLSRNVSPVRVEYLWLNPFPYSLSLCFQRKASRLSFSSFTDMVVAFVHFSWKQENKVEGSMAVGVSAADGDTDSPQLKTASGRCETCCWGHGYVVVAYKGYFHHNSFYHFALNCLHHSRWSFHPFLLFLLTNESTDRHECMAWLLELEYLKDGIDFCLLCVQFKKKEQKKEKKLALTMT